MHVRPQRLPKPTLAKVAELAGVSVSTASIAFSGSGPITPETRERVLEAAKKLGYLGPNPLGRQLRSGRTGIIGVVIGDSAGRSFSDPVCVQVLDGIMNELSDNGLGLLLVPGINSPRPGTVGGLACGSGLPTLDRLVEFAAMDVAILVWGTHQDDPNVAAFKRRGVPIVVGEGPSVAGAPLVAADDRGGAATAIRYLQSQGHTRIAEITSPINAMERSGIVRPERLAQADLAPTANRLLGVRDVIEPMISWETPASLVEAGRDAATQILGPDSPLTERPTAIFAHTDLLAAGALFAARDLGLSVPKDLSIVGFDGLDLPWLAPEVLTSVSQPLRAKGEALGRAVVGLLAGEEPATTVLPVELRLGTTSGPAPVA